MTKDSALDTPGLAGGPGPTPPGLDDGTPHASPAAPAAPDAAQVQRQAGEVAERGAGTRGTEVGRPGPEEADPDEDRR
jgi:hypothetical protein